MKEQFKEETYYVCNYCNNVYASEKMINIHLGECLQNYDDVHTCVSCKYAVLNLVEPSASDNGYNSMKLQNVVGVKAYLTCGNNIYNGKINEEKILREDKKCYTPMGENEGFEVYHTKGYIRYKQLMEQADIEQKEIDDEILDYHKTINELKDNGVSEEEAEIILKEKYGDIDD